MSNIKNKIEITSEHVSPQANGVIYVSFCQAIEIYEIEHGIEDYVRFRWIAKNAEDKTLTSSMSRSRIRYKQNGDAYFISEGRRWFFKDAIRQF